MTRALLIFILIGVVALALNGAADVTGHNTNRGRFDRFLEHRGGDPSCAFLGDGCPPKRVVERPR